MAASLQAAATLMQPSKVGAAGRSMAVQQLRCSPHISKAIGLDLAAGRVTCSLQSDIREFAQKCSDAAKLAGFALATSALVVSVKQTPFLSSMLLIDYLRHKIKHLVFMLKRERVRRECRRG